jgi:tRNA-specific 2-thiouridylase
VLGLNEDLFTRSFTVKDINWIACEAPTESMNLRVRVRYNQKEQPAKVIPTGADTARVEFESGQRAITTGQAAVFYDGDVVVGGGTISNT